MSLFHSHEQRDVQQFGTKNPEGHIKATATQKKNILEQSFIDLIKAIKLIIETYNSSVIDYAVWYRRHGLSGRCSYTYTHLKSVMACDCIISAGILANDRWERIEYPPSSNDQYEN